MGVREVIEQILEPFGLHDRRASHFFIAGDNVRLPPKAAITLAVVFHELATNAVKYGALAAEDTGRIEIAWKTEATPQATGCDSAGRKAGVHELRRLVARASGPV